MSTIPPLPFEHFLTYDEVTAFVERLAAACPDWVRLQSLGHSREGRDLHVLTITDPATGPAEDKPAYLIHGNIHAAELSGTHAALYTARELVETRPAVLRDVAFHIVPRINPDGAEFVATTSGVTRSRTDRAERRPNTLYQEDLNGDGLILSMRQEHPNGTFVQDPEEPSLLVRRTAESAPPYYRVFPEGMIHRWDGGEGIAVEGRSFDWNRNWSYDWRPEPEQGGAGDFPFSEPEMRALAEFIHARPNIFAVLGYHNGPNAVLRPPSTGADSDIDGGDLAILQELAEIGAAKTGFPVVPVIKYHVKRIGVKDCNLRGHFHNFGYHHLGLFVFEFELGNLLNSAGISTEEIFATQNQTEYEEQARTLFRWLGGQPAEVRALAFRDWEAWDHPQLGRVELGGWLNRQRCNPTLADLSRIARGTYEFTLEHASWCPKIVVEDLSVDAMGGAVYRVRARIANRGRLPTHVSNKGRGLRRLRPVSVEFLPATGIRLLSLAGHRQLGHLGGVSGSSLQEWFVQGANSEGNLCELRIQGGTGGVSRVRVCVSQTG
jgi:hypothetical protein